MLRPAAKLTATMSAVMLAAEKLMLAGILQRRIVGE
jgi:hypothetical protein